MFCDEVSIEHADGTTECLEPTCTLDHALHDFHVSCSAIVPPCPCSPAEHELDIELLIAA